MNEESEKVGLKLNIEKMKIMASSLITSWQMETVTGFIFWGSKITADIAAAAAAAAKSRQSCPTLCDPIDGSPPGSAVPGILQPRTLEWVAVSFSNA